MCRRLAGRGYVRDGAPAGTTGQARRLEAINLKLADAKYAGTSWLT